MIVPFAYAYFLMMNTEAFFIVRLNNINVKTLIIQCLKLATRYDILSPYIQQPFTVTHQQLYHTPTASSIS